MTLYHLFRLAWLRGRSDSPDDGIAWAQRQLFRVRDGRPEGIDPERVLEGERQARAGDGITLEQLERELRYLFGGRPGPL